MRKALVTGASRGIGAAIAEALAGRGIEVLRPPRQELNLADAGSIQAYLEARPEHGIGILVNNAGINVISPLEGVRRDDWQAMLQVNLSAPMQLIQGLVPAMKAAGWGRVINISSLFSLVTREGRSAYAVTKAGLNSLTRSAALELAPHGILVNAVCPGYIETDMTRLNNPPEVLAEIARAIPMRRLGRPEEIARLVAFLCSDDNTYITGQSLVIDGGFTCV